MKEIIVDYIPFEITPQQINESMKNNDGRLVVKGVLQRADAKNQNGRVYPKDILMREADKYNDGFIKQKRALGELDHPESSVINLKNVSHNVREIHWDGDDLMGTVEILPTPSGNILKELLKAGILLGISSRGMGSVEPRNGGGVTVGDDFELIGWDFVSNTSTHGAFMTPMNESKQMKIDEVCGSYCKAHDLIREIITELS